MDMIVTEHRVIETSARARSREGQRVSPGPAQRRKTACETKHQDIGFFLRGVFCYPVDAR